MCVVDAWSTDVAVQRRHRNVLKLSIREKEAWRSFTGEGGLEDDSSSRSGGLKSGNGFSRRKRTGQGHFFSKSSSCGWPFSWGLRAKGGTARRQMKDFTREFFTMFVSSPRSSDPARRCRAERLLKKVVFSTPETLSKSKSTPPLRFRGKIELR